MSSDSDRSDRFDADDGNAERSTEDDSKQENELAASVESDESDESGELGEANDGETAVGNGSDDGVKRTGGTDDGVRVDDTAENDDLLSRWTGSDTGPDRSVLNRAAIRRFTEGVLTTYGGEVTRESNGRWSVRLPGALAAELGTGTERATFVFDAADRTVGGDDVVVAPGTRAFNALCALARDSAPVSEAESTPAGGSVAADEREAISSAEAGTTGRAGFVHLSSDVLQLHGPPILDAAGFETVVEGFSSRGTERALAFHFRAQFLSVRSYQRTESVTIAVDPATRSVLPTLVARLTSHLPRLLDPRGDRHKGRESGDRENSGRDFSDDGFDRETVLGAYSTAKTAAIERVTPTAEDLRVKEEAAIVDRLEEIREYYDRQRAELDRKIDAKRATVEEYSRKYDRAQGDETRLRYLREQREAEDELASLTGEVEERTEKLHDEERARITEETERHRVDVDLDLARVTQLTYERGTLSLSVREGDVTAHPTVSYVPATDECYGLDCACCETDLTTSTTTDSDPDVTPRLDRPHLCVGGHLVCANCARSCRTCGEARCSSCLDATRTPGTAGEPNPEAGSGTETEAVSVTESKGRPEGRTDTETDSFGTCTLCREPVCADCAISCSVCGEQVCGDHGAVCDACDAVACLACGESCAACEVFHCDSHLVAPSGPATDIGDTEETGESATANGTTLYCEAHVAACTQCGERRGIDAIEFCGSCDDPLCESHEYHCSVCGEARCADHAVGCEHCIDSNGEIVASATFCEAHAERCVGGDEVVCEDHSRPGVIVDGWICEEHRAACDLCGVRYAEAGFAEGRCPACVGLSAETPAEPPVAAIAEEFSTTRIGITPTHAVIQGKRRLRRDEIVVVDRRTGEEVRRFKADFFSKLSGGP